MIQLPFYRIAILALLGLGFPVVLALITNKIASYFPVHRGVIYFLPTGLVSVVVTYLAWAFPSIALDFARALVPMVSLLITVRFLPVRKLP